MCTRLGPNFWAVCVFANCGVFRLCLVSCFGTVKGLQPSLLCQVVGFWLLTSMNQGSRKWKHRWFCHELSESNYDKLCAAQRIAFQHFKNHHLKQLGFWAFLHLPTSSTRMKWALRQWSMPVPKAGTQRTHWALRLERSTDFLYTVYIDASLSPSIYHLKDLPILFFCLTPSRSIIYKQINIFRYISV